MKVFRSSQMRRFVAMVAIAGTFCGIAPVIAQAQGLPGLTIFGGPGQDRELRYRLDRDGRVNAYDRYHLYVPSRKLELAAMEFRIDYPDTYTGEFDIDDLEVRIDGEAQPLNSVEWDEEARYIRIFMAEPIPARSNDVAIVVETRNPRSPGMHFFNATYAAPGDNAPINSLGTWVLTISR